MSFNRLVVGESASSSSTAAPNLVDLEGIEAVDGQEIDPDEEKNPDEGNPDQEEEPYSNFPLHLPGSIPDDCTDPFPMSPLNLNPCFNDSLPERKLDVTLPYMHYSGIYRPPLFLSSAEPSEDGDIKNEGEFGDTDHVRKFSGTEDVNGNSAEKGKSPSSGAVGVHMSEGQHNSIRHGAIWKASRELEGEHQTNEQNSSSADSGASSSSDDGRSSDEDPDSKTRKPDKLSKSVKKYRPGQKSHEGKHHADEEEDEEEEEEDESKKEAKKAKKEAKKAKKEEKRRLKEEKRREKEEKRKEKEEKKARKEGSKEKPVGEPKNFATSIDHIPTPGIPTPGSESAPAAIGSNSKSADASGGGADASGGGGTAGSPKKNPLKTNRFLKGLLGGSAPDGSGPSRPAAAGSDNLRTKYMLSSDNLLSGKSNTSDYHDVWLTEENGVFRLNEEGYIQPIITEGIYFGEVFGVLTDEVVSAKKPDDEPIGVVWDAIYKVENPREDALQLFDNVLDKVKNHKDKKRERAASSRWGIVRAKMREAVRSNSYVFIKKIYLTDSREDNYYLACYHMKGEKSNWFRAFRKPRDMFGLWVTCNGLFHIHDYGNWGLTFSQNSDELLVGGFVLPLDPLRKRDIDETSVNYQALVTEKRRSEKMEKWKRLEVNARKEMEEAEIIKQERLRQLQRQVEGHPSFFIRLGRKIFGKKKKKLKPMYAYASKVSEEELEASKSRALNAHQLKQQQENSSLISLLRKAITGKEEKAITDKEEMMGGAGTSGDPGKIGMANNKFQRRAGVGHGVEAVPGYERSSGNTLVQNGGPKSEQPVLRQSATAPSAVGGSSSSSLVLGGVGGSVLKHSSVLKQSASLQKVDGGDISGTPKRAVINEGENESKTFKVDSLNNSGEKLDSTSTIGSGKMSQRSESAINRFLENDKISDNLLEKNEPEEPDEYALIMENNEENVILNEDLKVRKLEKSVKIYDLEQEQEKARKIMGSNSTPEIWFCSLEELNEVRFRRTDKKPIHDARKAHHLYDLVHGGSSTATPGIITGSPGTDMISTSQTTSSRVAGAIGGAIGAFGSYNITTLSKYTRQDKDITKNMMDLDKIPSLMDPHVVTEKIMPYYSPPAENTFSGARLYTRFNKSCEHLAYHRKELKQPYRLTTRSSANYLVRNSWSWIQAKEIIRNEGAKLDPDFNEYGLDDPDLVCLIKGSTHPGISEVGKENDHQNNLSGVGKENDDQNNLSGVGKEGQHQSMPSKDDASPRGSHGSQQIGGSSSSTSRPFEQGVGFAGVEQSIKDVSIAVFPNIGSGIPSEEEIRVAPTEGLNAAARENFIAADIAPIDSDGGEGEGGKTERETLALSESPMQHLSPDIAERVLEKRIEKYFLSKNFVRYFFPSNIARDTCQTFYLESSYLDSGSGRVFTPFVQYIRSIADEKVRGFKVFWIQHFVSLQIHNSYGQVLVSRKVYKDMVKKGEYLLSNEKLKRTNSVLFSGRSTSSLGTRRSPNSINIDKRGLNSQENLAPQIGVARKSFAAVNAKLTLLTKRIADLKRQKLISKRRRKIKRCLRHCMCAGSSRSVPVTTIFGRTTSKGKSEGFLKRLISAEREEQKSFTRMEERCLWYPYCGLTDVEQNSFDAFHSGIEKNISMWLKLAGVKIRSRLFTTECKIVEERRGFLNYILRGYTDEDKNPPPPAGYAWIDKVLVDAYNSRRVDIAGKTGGFRPNVGKLKGRSRSQRAKTDRLREVFRQRLYLKEEFLSDSEISLSRKLTKANFVNGAERPTGLKANTAAFLRHCMVSIMALWVSRGVESNIKYFNHGIKRKNNRGSGRSGSENDDAEDENLLSRKEKLLRTLSRIRNDEVNLSTGAQGSVVNLIRSGTMKASNKTQKIPLLDITYSRAAQEDAYIEEDLVNFFACAALAVGNLPPGLSSILGTKSYSTARSSMSLGKRPVVPDADYPMSSGAGDAVSSIASPNKTGGASDGETTKLEEEKNGTTKPEEEEKNPKSGGKEGSPNKGADAIDPRNPVESKDKVHHAPWSAAGFFSSVSLMPASRSKRSSVANAFLSIASSRKVSMQFNNTNNTNDPLLEGNTQPSPLRKFLGNSVMTKQKVPFYEMRRDGQQLEDLQKVAKKTQQLVLDREFSGSKDRNSASSKALLSVHGDSSGKEGREPSREISKDSRLSSGSSGPVTREVSGQRTPETDVQNKNCENNNSSNDVDVVQNKTKQNAATDANNEMQKKSFFGGNSNHHESIGAKKFAQSIQFGSSHSLADVHCNHYGDDYGDHYRDDHGDDDDDSDALSDISNPGPEEILERQKQNVDYLYSDDKRLENRILTHNMEMSHLSEKDLDLESEKTNVALSTIHMMSSKIKGINKAIERSKTGFIEMVTGRAQSLIEIDEEIRPDYIMKTRRGAMKGKHLIFVEALFHHREYVLVDSRNPFLLPGVRKRPTEDIWRSFSRIITRMSLDPDVLTIQDDPLIIQEEIDGFKILRYVIKCHMLSMVFDVKSLEVNTEVKKSEKKEDEGEIIIKDSATTSNGNETEQRVSLY